MITFSHLNFSQIKDNIHLLLQYLLPFKNTHIYFTDKTIQHKNE
jgi:hypothetical protein